MRARAESIDCVLFDLDGTLADTAPDLGYALNLLRAERGMAPLPIERLRSHVSHGARGMLEAGLDLRPGDAEFLPLRDRFLEIYEQNLARESRLFEGMDELLDGIEARGLGWGIVTNKAERFAVPLIAALGLARRTGCLIGGDTTGRSKPHPDPLLAGARAIGVAPAACVYVGDDRRDVEASIAAGMTPVVALFGYLYGADPHDWGAQWMIAHPVDLLDGLRTGRRPGETASAP
ncbi:MAG: phosphoglycolate phosphatase [Proteobacteria bacterium]|nr:phosphoglycolate phosphatase [Burkholderiales bacterium]